MLSVGSEVDAVERVEWDVVERKRWGLDRLVRQRKLVEHADDPLWHFVLRFGITRQNVAHHPSEFEACPFVTHLPWLEEARVRPMRSVLGFECSEPVEVDGLTDGNISSVALSQFGVLTMFEYEKKELHFHDLVSGKHFNIGGFKDDTYVGWYKSDVVVVTRDESAVRRASFMSLLDKPDISTFKTFDVPKCTRWADLQLSQYIGKVLYESGKKLVVLDLETMKNERTDIEMQYSTNTTCVLPGGMIGLVGTNFEIFFITEDGKRGEGFAFDCEDAILSSSDPYDLEKALVSGGGYWYVLGSEEPVEADDFIEQTGWDGWRFIRLIDDVFLFCGVKKERDRWMHGWYVLRISVP